ncbi:MAG TPA: HU family DNA-binding protein [Solirubrobacteraceae bacterium]
MSTRTPQQRMTKHELAKQVAAGADLTGEQAKSALDTAFDVIAGELAAGRDIAIAGFGKFSVTERAAREGRNPATAQTIQIAASRAARFSAAAALKQQLNN